MIPAPDYETLIRQLSRCKFLPGSWDKRFVRDLAARLHPGETLELTDNQRAQLDRLAHSYRKQLAKLK
jgi:hypothetical protein